MTPCKIAGCHLASKRLNLSSSLSALRKNTPMATRAPNLAPWRQAAEPLRRPAWMSFVPFLRADRRHPPAGAPFRAPVQGHARTPRPSRGCAALWGARLRRGRAAAQNQRERERFQCAVWLRPRAMPLLR